MIVLGWAVAALAGELPACEVSLRPPTEAVSVAWVSPLGQRVGRRGWLEVVRTADLRRALEAQSGGVGRMLQLLGVRRKARDPARPWKVTVFDVHGVDLCRPLAGHEDPAAVEGAVTCPERLGRVTRTYDGCGWTTDLGADRPGLEIFRIRWEDAARNGFCVLPADRYVR